MRIVVKDVLSCKKHYFLLDVQSFQNIYQFFMSKYINTTASPVSITQNQTRKRLSGSHIELDFNTSYLSNLFISPGVLLFPHDLNVQILRYQIPPLPSARTKEMPVFCVLLIFLFSTALQSSLGQKSQGPRYRF